MVLRNLTVANHMIFISPLLARTQHEYNQAETQAIGRIRRYGQTRTANLYRFVTCSTIDEEIYKSRGQYLGDLSHRVQKFGSTREESTSGVKPADVDVMEID
jgi:SNF2 family DNA or RNA helicase